MLDHLITPDRLTFRLMQGTITRRTRRIEIVMANSFINFVTDGGWMKFILYLLCKIIKY